MYDVDKFVKPVKGVPDLAGHNAALLTNFRFERCQSPMADVIRAQLGL